MTVERQLHNAWSAEESEGKTSSDVDTGLTERFEGKSLSEPAIGFTQRTERRTWADPGLGFVRLGFTLIELLVVMAVVALLLTLALPRYFQSIDVSKETVLIENLRVARDAIDKFYSDNGRYPESLEELVEKKYLRSLPYDPIVESSERWLIAAPPTDVKGNVYDLRSAAAGAARNGKPYGEL